jgi:hypothetical protein
MYSECNGNRENIVASGCPLAEMIAQGQQSGNFVLMLCGDSLAPFFNDGDVLTVNTTVTPSAFDAVVADLGESDYRCMILGPDGGLWDMGGRRVPPAAYVRIGVVVNLSSRRVYDRMAQMARSAG